jgi:hypothetical protein
MNYMAKRFTGLEGIEGRCREKSGYEDQRRKARLREFKKGWRMGSGKKTFEDSSTLDTLSWHNLGWRLGWMLGGKGDTDDRLEAIFDQLVLQYQESGRVQWSE